MLNLSFSAITTATATTPPSSGDVEGVIVVVELTAAAQSFKLLHYEPEERQRERERERERESARESERETSNSTARTRGQDPRPRDPNDS